MMQPCGEPPFIELRAVSKQYASDGGVVSALEDVSLSVAGGEFVSIIGPSGCGKSTLLMIMAGLLRADKGQVGIRGQRIESAYTDAGIVFQNAELFEWRTALQNVLLQIEVRGLNRQTYLPKARALLAKTGLGEFLDKYPYELSGGMRQRVALCRALIHDPDILLMDEPFGPLDALTRDQMNLDLQRLWLEARKTAVLITHSIDEAVFLSDRVVIMTPRPGRVSASLGIDLPRPRPLSVKQSAVFNNYAATLRQHFQALGVFHDA
jgi:NitT/TauT family transport system ATP-binding protein